MGRTFTLLGAGALLALATTLFPDQASAIDGPRRPSPGGPTAPVQPDAEEIHVDIATVGPAGNVETVWTGTAEPFVGRSLQIRGVPEIRRAAGEQADLIVTAYATENREDVVGMALVLAESHHGGRYYTPPITDESTLEALVYASLAANLGEVPDLAAPYVLTAIDEAVAGAVMTTEDPLAHVDGLAATLNVGVTTLERALEDAEPGVQPDALNRIIRSAVQQQVAEAARAAQRLIADPEALEVLAERTAMVERVYRLAVGDRAEATDLALAHAAVNAAVAIAAPAALPEDVALETIRSNLLLAGHVAALTNAYLLLDAYGTPVARDAIADVAETAADVMYDARNVHELHLALIAAERALIAGPGLEAAPGGVLADVLAARHGENVRNVLEAMSDDIFAAHDEMVVDLTAYALDNLPIEPPIGVTDPRGRRAGEPRAPTYNPATVANMANDIADTVVSRIDAYTSEVEDIYQNHLEQPVTGTPVNLPTNVYRAVLPYLQVTTAVALIDPEMLALEQGLY